MRRRLKQKKGGGGGVCHVHVCLVSIRSKHTAWTHHVLRQSPPLDQQHARRNHVEVAQGPTGLNTSLAAFSFVAALTGWLWSEGSTGGWRAAIAVVRSRLKGRREGACSIFLHVHTWHGGLLFSYELVAIPIWGCCRFINTKTQIWASKRKKKRAGTKETKPQKK
jgi:hypothetical protein